MVEDEERCPYMLEFTKGDSHFDVFKSFGNKKSPVKPLFQVKIPTPDRNIAKFKEPEPEDLESLIHLTTVQETVGHECIKQAIEPYLELEEQLETPS